MLDFRIGHAGPITRKYHGTMMKFFWTSAGLLLLGLPLAAGTKGRTKPRPRKVYGHYMGCFVAGAGAIQWHATSGLTTMDAPRRVTQTKDPVERNLGPWASRSCGGTYRNFALAPYHQRLKLEEAADLELRRAMRIGFDGFTFDAWAGGGGAVELFNAMMKICEEKDYPFELTITLDSSCIKDDMAALKPYKGNKWVKCVKWLLDKHGKSPKLARRDGKVMIMGYQSLWPAYGKIMERAAKNVGGWKDKAAVEKEIMRLRASEEGWKLIGDAYRQMDKDIGQPIYWQFCLGAFSHNLRPAPSKDTWVKAAAVLAKDFPAVGMFMWEGPVPDIAKAVLAQGAEWCHPMKMQYENYGWLQIASPGTDWVRGDWNAARTWPSTLVQFITWNDYQENTNVSPGYNTRYSYYDLTGHLLKWWKTGKEPRYKRDKLYIFSHKYQHGGKFFPFKPKQVRDNVIEVLTILSKPAKVRVPGRKFKDGKKAEWNAPAGMSWKKLPLTKGPVSAEIIRGGKRVVRVVCPEPVGDRPFRQDTGKVCMSTEFKRHWELDFGKKEKPFIYSEYSDVDHDGLPNWFEMLWFGKFGDMSTAHVADPKADPDKDGKTNLEEYLKQSDPTIGPPPKGPGAAELGDDDDEDDGTLELLED